MNILIYGLGRVGNMYYNAQKDNYNVIGFLQTEKTQDTFCDVKVYDLGELDQISFDEIHIANMYFETLKSILEKGVSKDRIVICHYNVLSQYILANKGISDIRFSIDMVLTGRMPEKAIYSDRIRVGVTEVIMNRDYFRWGVLKNLANQIKQDAVDGDMAELGVFRGEFSSAMNSLFPDRNLLLFDTFEGFTDEDLQIQMKLDGDNSIKAIGNSDFKNTNEDYVMRKMLNPKNCIICKGSFPDTIPSKEYRYALVSIDCDLYKPAYEGLKYFYPRLSRGGYIMMHDYNDMDFGDGIHQALEDFEREQGRVPKVPLADLNGTVVICK